MPRERMTRSADALEARIREAVGDLPAPSPAARERMRLESIRRAEGAPRIGRQGGSRALAGLAVAATVAALAFGYFASRPLPAAAVVARALAVLEQPGVLHYREDLTSTQAKGVSRSSGEYWIDVAGGRLKRASVSPDSAEVRREESLIASGTAVGVRYSDDGVFADESAPYDITHDGAYARAAECRAMLERGDLRLNGTATIEGERAYVLSGAYPSEDGAVTTAVVYHVSVEDFRLLRMETTRPATPGASGPDDGLNEVWRYTGFEVLPPDRVPASVFTIEIPGNAVRTVRRSYSRDSLARFDAFDLYWVGERLGDLVWDGAFSYTNEDPNPPLIRVRHEVAETRYTRGASDPSGVSVSIRPRMPEGRLGELLGNARGRRADVPMGRALVGGSSTWGWTGVLNSGRSTVMVSANDEADMMRVLQALRPVK